MSANKYQEVIHSQQWRNLQKSVLTLQGHRDPLFLIPLGQCGGRYHKYNIHHMHYKFLGNDCWLGSVIAVSPFTHWIIHNVLGLSSRAGSQKFLGGYPNILQIIFHIYLVLSAITLCQLFRIFNR